jgi:2,5-diketo-D-gluconate reductase A
MTLAPSISLNNGVLMPGLGLGTAPLADDEVRPAVRTALETGYRLIDTAERYGNEKGVGEGIRASGVPREELFVTTKLDGRFQGGERAVGGLDGCLDRLGLDYVDLLLIHWPLPHRGQYVDTWRTFERLLNAGRTRAIGVSNFKSAHLDALQSATDVVPAVNQIQLNPSVTRSALRAHHGQRAIVTQGYSPLSSGWNGLLHDRAILKIAAGHDKEPAQVVLRWHIQLGVVPLPRSRRPDHIASNIDVFDFALTEREMASITALDRGEAAAAASDVVGH